MSSHTASTFWIATFKDSHPHSGSTTTWLSSYVHVSILKVFDALSDTAGTCAGMCIHITTLPLSMFCSGGIFHEEFSQCILMKLFVIDSQFVIVYCENSGAYVKGLFVLERVDIEIGHIL
jgi:hypothetical protein